MKTKNDKKTILVFGASNQIGIFLMQRLLTMTKQFNIIAVSRYEREDYTDIQWVQADLTQPNVPMAELNPDIVIYTAPLPLLPNLLKTAPTSLKRLIAFSTTSRYSKKESSNNAERQLMRNYIHAENTMINQCKNHQIQWTLFRPTMVYGNGQDQNISFIAKFIQGFGFFPVLGRAKGIRQPIHADDLALACLHVLDCNITFNKAYNLSGGSNISYYQMVEQIFASLKKSSRIVRLPKSLLYVALLLLNRTARFKHLSIHMFERMNQDLYFNHEIATQDFGFNPRPFKPDPKTLGINI